jgi:hypothetical protein
MPKMVHKQVWQKLHIFQNISQTGPTKTYDTVLPLSRYKYLSRANIFYHIICAYTACMEDVWVLQLCSGHSTSNVWPHKLLQNSKHLRHVLLHCRIIFTKHSQNTLITILCWTVTVPLEALSVNRTSNVLHLRTVPIPFRPPIMHTSDSSKKVIHKEDGVTSFMTMVVKSK